MKFKRQRSIQAHTEPWDMSHEPVVLTYQLPQQQQNPDALGYYLYHLNSYDRLLQTLEVYQGATRLLEVVGRQGIGKTLLAQYLYWFRKRHGLPSVVVQNDGKVWFDNGKCEPLWVNSGDMHDAQEVMRINRLKLAMSKRSNVWVISDDVLPSTELLAMNLDWTSVHFGQTSSSGRKALWMEEWSWDDMHFVASHPGFMNIPPSQLDHVKEMFYLFGATPGMIYQFFVAQPGQSWQEFRQSTKLKLRALGLQLAQSNRRRLGDMYLETPYGAITVLNQNAEFASRVIASIMVNQITRHNLATYHELLPQVAPPNLFEVMVTRHIAGLHGALVPRILQCDSAPQIDKLVEYTPAETKQSFRHYAVLLNQRVGVICYRDVREIYRRCHHRQVLWANVYGHQSCIDTFGLCQKKRLFVFKYIIDEQPLHISVSDLLYVLDCHSDHMGERARNLVMFDESTLPRRGELVLPATYTMLCYSKDPSKALPPKVILHATDLQLQVFQRCFHLAWLPISFDDLMSSYPVKY